MKPPRLSRRTLLGAGLSMSYHDLGAFQRVMSGRWGATMAEDSRAFHDWLVASMSLEADAT